MKNGKRKLAEPGQLALRTSCILSDLCGYDFLLRRHGSQISERLLLIIVFGALQGISRRAPRSRFFTLNGGANQPKPRPVAGFRPDKIQGR